jgi:hypothetical protein
MIYEETERQIVAVPDVADDTSAPKALSAQPQQRRAERLFLDVREHDEHLHQKLRPRVPEPDVPVSACAASAFLYARSSQCLRFCC